MKRIENIILHCSDSAWGSASEIRRWHLANSWKDIGYHFVICNGLVRPKFYIPEMDGSLEVGRYLDEDSFISDNEVGAHTLGYNANSIGICLIGKGIEQKFTGKQFWTLKALVEFMLEKHKLLPKDVYGHYEKQQGKECPCFDMKWFRECLFRSPASSPSGIPFEMDRYWFT